MRPAAGLDILSTQGTYRHKRVVSGKMYLTKRIPVNRLLAFKEQLNSYFHSN